MRSTGSKRKVVLRVVGLALAIAHRAYAGPHATLSTSSLVANPDGYLECRVTATSQTPIGIVAVVLGGDAGNVTDFGTGFRASPGATGDGRYYAEETAGSLSDGACYCTATVTGAHRKDVHVTLTAYDASHHPTAHVEVDGTGSGKDD